MCIRDRIEATTTKSLRDIVDSLISGNNERIFSEDIDLSVDTRGCSRTQNDKRLERAAKKYGSLPRDATQGKTNRSEVIAVYTYDPITACLLYTSRCV